VASKYFSDDELRCKCGCGQVRMNDVFLAKADQLRELLGMPLPVTSGYRCENHPAEKGKSTTGAHRQGKAIDIACHGADSMRIMSAAHALAFTGIGAKQHGPIEKRIVHIDTISGTPEQPRPWFWTYPS